MIEEISLIRRISCRDRLRAWITVSLCVVGVEYAIRLRDKILLAKDFNRGSLIFLEAQRPCYIVSYLRLLYESSNYINTASLVSVLVPVLVLVRGSVLVRVSVLVPSLVYCVTKLYRFKQSFESLTRHPADLELPRRLTPYRAYQI